MKISRAIQTKTYTDPMQAHGVAAYFAREKFSLQESVNTFEQERATHEAIDVLVTPLIARELLSHNYAGQRSLKNAFVQHYASLMKAGTFREYTTIHFAVFEGVPYLINGQHTLNAVVASGKDLWLSLDLLLVQHEIGIQELYRRHDTGMRLRTFDDCAGNIGEELGLNKHDRNALHVAVKQLHLNFSISNGSTGSQFDTKNTDLMVQLMREWKNEAGAYFEGNNTVQSQINRTIFQRGAIVALGLLTFRSHPEIAGNFWKVAATDDGLRSGDPRKTLFNWLRDNKTQGHTHDQAPAAISCWNAFYRGDQLNKVYTNSISAKTVLGCFRKDGGPVVIRDGSKGDF